MTIRAVVHAELHGLFNRLLHLPPVREGRESGPGHPSDWRRVLRQALIRHVADVGIGDPPGAEPQSMAVISTGFKSSGKADHSFGCLTPRKSGTTSHYRDIQVQVKPPSFPGNTRCHASAGQRPAMEADTR
jgi:hypothetical protein